jgi:hypothetical protein
VGATSLAAGGELPAKEVGMALGEPAGERLFQGFGGNYCFQYDTPATDFTLRELRPAWLRTEVDLAMWEPANDNGDPATTAWETLHKAAEGEALARRFALYRKLAGLKRPVIASAWTGPEWLFENPGRGYWTTGRRVARDNWPELVECIGSYLEYAKRSTGLAPELFSFNEPALGIRFQFGAKELAELGMMLVRDFRSRGLDTRLVLGDVASPHLWSYAEDLRRFTTRKDIYGAVGFHSWGGANEAVYGRWRRLAEDMDLPLLVTETGLEGGDYKTPWIFARHSYALREATLYAQLLNLATPAATLHWQYTPDYQLVTVENGSPVANPVRVGQMRQFRNHTPVPARHVRVQCTGSASVTACAFAGEHDHSPSLAIHMVNSAGVCNLRINGLPEAIDTLEKHVTTHAGPLPGTMPVPVSDGVALLPLPARAMTTLRTATPADR